MEWKINESMEEGTLGMNISKPNEFTQMKNIMCSHEDAHQYEIQSLASTFGKTKASTTGNHENMKHKFMYISLMHGFFDMYRLCSVH